MANFISSFLVLISLSALPAQSRHLLPTTSTDVDYPVFNVLAYGAIGDGLADDTQAFMDAWEATCTSSASSPTMFVPAGKTFLLQPSTFTGQDCKSNNITFLVNGNLTAPRDPHDWKCPAQGCQQWIGFDHFDGLSVHGSGTLNGQGAKWWPLLCHHNNCGRKPSAFHIGHSSKVNVSNLTFMDNPQCHVALKSSTWVRVSNLTIEAPSNSPNTDGIHIQGCSNVSISHSKISTGDDCISIGDGTSYLNISNITCGPGHGISIGSLGKNGEHHTVEHIHVKGAIFMGTTNGVRIKTWQGGRGYARNIIFEHIISYGSRRPIIIDQFYCPHENCKTQKSAVEISNVMYNHISGASSDEITVDFSCSETVPCRNILMNTVNLWTTQHGKESSSYCSNVQGFTIGGVSPAVPCLGGLD